MLLCIVLKNYDIKNIIFQFVSYVVTQVSLFPCLSLVIKAFLKEKALYFSSFNGTFALLFEQGSPQSYFALGPADCVASLEVALNQRTGSLTF